MLSCSHVLCRVDDIQATVTDYEKLGFSMTWGSDPKKAHNAMIWFTDGPFIEFFEFPTKLAPLRWPVALRFGAGMGRRLRRWSGPGEGWRDIALETDDLDLTATRAQLLASGVPVTRIFRNSRTRPDGQRVRYQLVAPDFADLPFVVSSYDPPQRPTHIEHPNGARAITSVRYGVSAGRRTIFDRLVGADRWLHPEPAVTSGVIAVEVDGLRGPLDPALLHGTAITPVQLSPSVEEYPS